MTDTLIAFAYLLAGFLGAVLVGRMWYAHHYAIRVTPAPLRFVLANLGRGIARWAEREDIYGDTLIDFVRREFDTRPPLHFVKPDAAAEFRRRLAHANKSEHSFLRPVRPR